MGEKRQSRLPALIAFLRDRPNLAYSVEEIARELTAITKQEVKPGNIGSALGREAAKETSQIVHTGTRGFYMWTTTPQAPKENGPEVDPAYLEKVGTTKSGDNIYRDKDTEKLYRLICEEL